MKKLAIAVAVLFAAPSIRAGACPHEESAPKTAEKAKEAPKQEAPKTDDKAKEAPKKDENSTTAKKKAAPKQDTAKKPDKVSQK